MGEPYGYGKLSYIGELVTWEDVFRYLRSLDPSVVFPYTAAGFPVSRRKDPRAILLAVPEKPGIDQVSAWFKNMLAEHAIDSTIGPVQVGDTTHALSSCVRTGDRAAPGSYTKWLHPDYTGNRIPLRNTTTQFDTSLTLLEALWYNIRALHLFGDAYIALNKQYTQRCDGTRGGLPGMTREQTPFIRWDLAQRTVSLLWE